MKKTKLICESGAGAHYSAASAVAAKFKWGLTGSDLIVMLDRAQSSYQDMIENKAFEKLQQLSEYL